MVEKMHNRCIDFPFYQNKSLKRHHFSQIPEKLVSVGKLGKLGG